MAKIKTDAVLEQPTENNSNLEQLLAQMNERMSRLEAENAQLKEKWPNVYEKAKEKYSWPVKMRYRLWAGVPVLSIQTVKKNKTQDLVYKDPMSNAYIENQYFEVTLADWTIDKLVLRKSFMDGKTLSDEVECGAITLSGDRINKVTVPDLSRVKIDSFIFNIDGKELLVASNCIN